MKNVTQGNTIEFDIWFYDTDPAAGGVPVDPDGWEHTWQVQNDVNNRVSGITLLENAVWPALTPLYFAIIDSGADFEVKGYETAADRTGDVNAIVSTGTLSYGIYAGQALNDLGAGYAGTIDITFPGLGAPGQEDFEIADIGQTEPTYEIHDQNNNVTVASTVYPTKIEVGHYSTTYDVASDAVPGQNWRIVSRAKISGVDSFTSENFNVVDAAVAEEEGAWLITLDELKNQMSNVSDDDDILLSALLGAVSQAIEEYCGQFFHVVDASITIDGNNVNKIHINEGPIYEVTKIEQRWGVTQWNEKTLTNFQVSDWFITRVDGGVFDQEVRNWRIEYTRGHDQAPRQVRHAVVVLVRYWWQFRNRTGVVADVVGGGLRINYEEIMKDLPLEVKQILKPFRRIL